MKTPNKPELIKQFIDALGSPVKPLTEWETNFLESISDQFDRRGTLSDKQFDILDRIYTEKTA